jgi:hypothetical protein
MNSNVKVDLLSHLQFINSDRDWVSLMEEPADSIIRVVPD